MEFLEAIGHAIMTGLKCLNEYIDIFTLIVAIFGARLLFKRTNIAEISQVNEQYIKSIEQLGKDSIAGRLGGIYGLEKVAQSQRFYKQVIEVLTAYVRQHAVKPENETDYQPEKDKAAIQAILTVLGRLPRPKKDNERVPFDLSGAYLKNYRIEGNFSHAIFTEADFTGADCWGANFTGASCYLATFTQTKCGDANFTEAFCCFADFTGAICWGANFTGASCILAIGVTEEMKQAGAIYL